MVLIILFVCALISSRSHASNLNDFCVADLKGLDSPSGYQCKPPNKVTIDDFVSSFKDSSTAYVTDVPGLNGLNLAALHIELAPGEMVSLHTHPDVGEIIIVIDGEVTAGFFTIKSSFVKTLYPGELMAIPKGLLHFAVNSGEERNATIITTYSTSYPIFQYLSDNLFTNNISSNLVAQITYLDVSQVQKLKDRFGGHG